MYELCFGEIPFNGNEDDPMSVYFSIINKKLSFPSNFSDSLFMSLLSNMLEKCPHKRYSRIELIQNHPWFKKFNFQDVEYLKINPEFIPNVEDILFESNQSFWKHSLIMYKDWQKNSGIIIDDNKREECESWFEDFSFYFLFSIIVLFILYVILILKFLVDIILVKYFFKIYSFYN